jgi:methionyl-tRNA formyltransferase
LPRWRGAAPIHAAVLAGDQETGITIMQMDPGLDTGPMLLQRRIPIPAAATTAILHDQLAAVGAELVLHALGAHLAPQPQPADGATYAPKLSKEDGRIDWSRAAAFIERQVRAFDPWPGTFTTLGGAVLKLLAVETAELAVETAELAGPAGTTIDDRLTVACGSGAIRVTRLQIAGRAALEACAFLRGHPVPAGTVLGT